MESPIQHSNLTASNPNSSRAPDLNFQIEQIQSRPSISLGLVKNGYYGHQKNLASRSDARSRNVVFSGSGWGPMEVEVKLRLLTSSAHERVCSILAPYHRRTYLQENLFFDGRNGELSSNLAALRLRFYDLDSRCVLSLKSKPQISDGISRIEEQEEPLDPAAGRLCAAEPWRLLQIECSGIINRLKEEYKLGGDRPLVCLGGFRNVRGVYDWNGLKLEVDETHYSFGTTFEIECENSEPETARNLLEGLLKSHGIDFRYSEVSKFAIFRSAKLPD